VSLTIEAVTAGAAETVTAGAADQGLAGVPDPKGDSRGEVGAVVLSAVRSVPGLRPASPVRPERARWMPFEPAVLAVGLDDSRLEVQLAATRLPLTPLLEQHPPNSDNRTVMGVS
jgi:hypothetical protein